MPDYFGEIKGRKYTKFVLVSDLVVFQPATPLRVVQVAVNDGKYSHWDLPFMGMRSFIKSEYTRNDHRMPSTATHESLLNDGFLLRSDGGHEIETEVLVWCEEYQCVLNLDDARAGNTKEIVAPASMSADWWNEAIKTAAKELGSEVPDEG